MVTIGRNKQRMERCFEDNEKNKECCGLLQISLLIWRETSASIV